MPICEFSSSSCKLYEFVSISNEVAKFHSYKISSICVIRS